MDAATRTKSPRLACRYVRLQHFCARYELSLDDTQLAELLTRSEKLSDDEFERRLIAVGRQLPAPNPEMKGWRAILKAVAEGYTQPATLAAYLSVNRPLLNRRIKKLVELGYLSKKITGARTVLSVERSL